mgnify:CR=1 FL=1
MLLLLFCFIDLLLYGFVTTSFYLREKTLASSELIVDSILLL